MNNPLVVRVSEEQKISLKILADSQNVSVAKITRKAIEEYISKTAKDKGNLLVRLAKIGESKKLPGAPKDLSQNYKNYLYSKKRK